MALTQASEKAKDAAPGAWAPFGHAAFTVLWVATVVSNVGTWMNDVGAGWLMTELTPSPFVVADIVDRRKMLLVVNILMFVTVSALAVLVALEAMTPVLLIVFTFLIGTGAAFLAPAWQAIQCIAWSSLSKSRT